MGKNKPELFHVDLKPLAPESPFSSLVYPSLSWFLLCLFSTLAENLFLAAETLQKTKKNIFLAFAGI